MTLKLDSISARYGSLLAVDGFDAEAVPGRLTAVIGPNAAGKSTLLRCAAGIQSCRGSVEFGGRSVESMSHRDRARCIAWMAQRPRSDVPMTVHEMVELARPRNEQDPGRCRELMHSLELDDLRSRLVPALSVGQQQRVALARTLYQLKSPGGMLVLDEPTAPMDPRHAMLAIEHLRDAARQGTTVLLSLHDIGLAAAVADDAWLLRRGRRVGGGPSGEVLVPGLLREAFGIDYETLQRSDGSSWLAPAPPSHRV